MELKSAIEFRTKGAALSIACTEGFGHIFFGNCTTLSSRIRCDASALTLIITDRLSLFKLIHISLDFETAWQKD